MLHKAAGTGDWTVMRVNDNLFRMLDLSQRGLNCSQILVQMGLEDSALDNPQLVRAMAGLGGGIGFTGHICGALSGGACLLSLHGQFQEDEEGTAGDLKVGGVADADLRVTQLVMIGELMEWFENRVGSTYGGINCRDILGLAGNSSPQTMDAGKCAQIVSETYDKVREILAEHELTEEGPDDD